ncbi:unnamed protein product [Somion occarium]|uniref:Uncharacterized protein n=1 Tax=Somion occarium TaxID=3059160 RepID=A0ABP1DPF2_9APHY
MHVEYGSCCGRQLELLWKTIFIAEVTDDDTHNSTPSGIRKRSEEKDTTTTSKRRTKISTLSARSHTKDQPQRIVKECLAPFNRLSLLLYLAIVVVLHQRFWT